MRVLLTTYGSRRDVEPMAGLAVHLGAPGAEARVCAPSHGAAAEECESDAPVAAGVMADGVRR